MKTLVRRFWGLNVWVKVVFCFCLVGMLDNTILIGRDLSSGGILLRLHVGFWLLYAAQAAFILLHERLVFILPILQGIMALIINADFTFMPLMRVIGRFVYICGPEPTLEMMKVYRYVLISAAFTLQMLSAFVLFSLLPAPKKPTPQA